MKINFGAIRTFAHRAVPVANFLMIAMVWLGVSSKWWSVVALIFLTLIYVVFDYKIMFSQEQEFYFQRNPEWKRRMDELVKRK